MIISEADLQQCLENAAEERGEMFDVVVAVSNSGKSIVGIVLEEVDGGFVVQTKEYGKFTLKKETEYYKITERMRANPDLLRAKIQKNKKK